MLFKDSCSVFRWAELELKGGVYRFLRLLEEIRPRSFGMILGGISLFSPIGSGLTVISLGIHLLGILGDSHGACCRGTREPRGTQRLEVKTVVSRESGLSQSPIPIWNLNFEKFRIPPKAGSNADLSLKSHR
nr:hypothetical protein Iba_scaffold234277CG0010 [Ipomoea batatas]